MATTMTPALCADCGMPEDAQGECTNPQCPASPAYVEPEPEFTPGSREDPNALPPQSPADLCWVDKPLVLSLLKQYQPELVTQDRAPTWAVITTDVFVCCMVWHMIKLPFKAFLKRVEERPNLQLALTGAYRMKVAAFELAEMIESWKEEE